MIAGQQVVSLKTLFPYATARASAFAYHAPASDGNHPVGFATFVHIAKRGNDTLSPLLSGHRVPKHLGASSS